MLISFPVGYNEFVEGIALICNSFFYGSRYKLMNLFYCPEYCKITNEMHGGIKWIF